MSSTFAGLGIPEWGRGEFIAAGVAAFAAFSLLGLFAGLAPTFVASVLHEPNHAVQGAVVFGLLAVGTVQNAARQLYRSRGFQSFGIEPNALKIGGAYVDEDHMILRISEQSL